MWDRDISGFLWRGPRHLGKHGRRQPQKQNCHTEQAVHRGEHRITQETPRSTWGSPCPLRRRGFDGFLTFSACGETLFFHRFDVHCSGPFQFVPGEGSPVHCALQGLQNDEREQLAVGEAL